MISKIIENCLYNVMSFFGSFAKKYNCTVCSIEKVIKNIGAKEYQTKYLKDAIHPNQAGHILFANELVKCFVK